MEFLIQIAIVVLLLGLGLFVGSMRERRHIGELTQREQASSNVLVVDVRTLPQGQVMGAGTLVMGNVVIATDYFKRFAAGLRTLVGGEVRSYKLVMDRARREARLRMIEEAGRQGSTTIINVRYITAEVAGGAAEVLCYGTAVR